MDIVYVLGKKEPNLPLMYSLRSLKNIPHDKVVFSGHWPKRYKPDTVIQVQQNARTKWQNSTRNIDAACRSMSVSEDFMLFNDDFYVMEPVDGPPSYQRGSTDKMLSELRQRVGVYAQGLQYTVDLMKQYGIPGPYTAYDLHTPMVINKRKMRATMNIVLKHMDNNHPCIHVRTFYGNMHSVEAEFTEDCKLWKPGAVYADKIPYFSTGPAGFSSVQKKLDHLFPEKCRYEY